MKKVIFAAITIMASFSAQGATVNWGAGTDNGFNDANGQDLAQLNIARVGYFDVSDTILFQNRFDVSFLNSHFTEFASAPIGAGFDAPGHFGASSNANPAATGGFTSNIVGLQMYYWILSSTNRSSTAFALSTATAQGIFYVNKLNNSGWAFPSQTPVPGFTTTDVTDLTDASGEALVPGASIVIGSFGPGTSDLGGSTNFTLAPVPEPTSAFLVAVGAAGLMMRRRRQS